MVYASHSIAFDKNDSKENDSEDSLWLYVENDEADSDFDESAWQEFGGEGNLEGFQELRAEDGTIDLSINDLESVSQLIDRGAFHRLAPYYSSIGYTWALSKESSVKIVSFS